MEKMPIVTPNIERKLRNLFALRKLNVRLNASESVLSIFAIETKEEVLSGNLAQFRLNTILLSFVLEIQSAIMCLCALSILFLGNIHF
jgi:hypothetical protein